MWKPIIKNKNLLALVEDKLVEISELIEKIDSKHCSLLGGQCGIILFHSYYSKFKPSKPLDCDLNIQILFDYFQAPSSLNYSRGVSGILYVLDHLEKENFFDFDGAISDFDYSVFHEYILNENTLDYLHGNSGSVLSLLQQNVRKEYDYLFDSWISSIERKREGGALRWKIDLFKHTNSPEKGYCFGLAHGIPGIIIILIKLYKRRKSSRVLEYIEQSIHFLLENMDKDSEFYFPTVIVNGVKSKGKLAWCYGDLGVAFSLYLYGDLFENKTCNLLSIEIFLKHASVRSQGIYDLDDADFCHGTVGIAHIYARMYNYTDIEEFREASEYWYKVTIEKAIHKDGFAGYKHSVGHGEPLVNEYGLLEGVSGIGLSLISSISNIEPKWDSVFLLS